MAERNDRHIGHKNHSYLLSDVTLSPDRPVSEGRSRLNFLCQLGFFFSSCTVDESPCGAVANVLDCNNQVNKFKLLSHNYIDFQTNMLGKGMNILITEIWVK